MVCNDFEHADSVNSLDWKRRFSKFFRKSVPERPPGLQGLLSEFENDIEKAIDVWRKGCARYPLVVDYFLNLQVLLNTAGREAEAFDANNRQLAISPKDKRSLFNRGWHLLRRGQWAEGFQHLENGRSLGVYGSPQPGPEGLRWRGENLAGKTLLFQLEGGLGDEVIGFRFHRMFAAMGANVIVACHRDLIAFFSHQPSVTNVVDRDFTADLTYDYWVQSMSGQACLGLLSKTCREKNIWKPMLLAQMRGDYL